MTKIRLIVLLVAYCGSLSLAQNKPPSSETPQSPSQSAHQPVRVPTAIMLGRVEHKTLPVYPDEAMSKGIQGDVIFKIDVDETGAISSSNAVAGDPLLIAAAKEALRTFRFHPYLVDGTPVKVQSQLGFHFATEKAANGVTGHVECIPTLPDRP